MIRVYIPPSARALASGKEFAEVSATTVREAVKQLDQLFPGIADLLIQNNQLRAGWCVSIGGSVSSLGLLTKVPPDSEVHFLPLVGGG